MGSTVPDLSIIIPRTMRNCAFRPLWNGLRHTYRAMGVKRKSWLWTTALRMAQPRWRSPFARRSHAARDFEWRQPRQRLQRTPRDAGSARPHRTFHGRGSFRAIEEAVKLIDALEIYDVAIGSRAMDRSLISVHESPSVNSPESFSIRLYESSCGCHLSIRSAFQSVPARALRHHLRAADD